MSSETKRRADQLLRAQLATASTTLLDAIATSLASSGEFCFAPTSSKRTLLPMLGAGFDAFLGSSWS